jgi:hypothetical protein
MNDTRELGTRIRKERRAPLDAYISGILLGRSGTDRRSPDRINTDNAFVNHESERWYRSHRLSHANG